MKITVNINTTIFQSDSMRIREGTIESKSKVPEIMYM